MRCLSRYPSFLAVAVLCLAACEGSTPTTAVELAPQAAKTAQSADGKKKIRGLAQVTVWGVSVDGTPAGMAEIDFSGVAGPGAVPIAGEGTVVRRRYDRQRDLVTYVIEFTGTLGGEATARPIVGTGRIVVSRFDIQDAMDGNDWFMEGVGLSFDADYGVDGNDW